MHGALLADIARMMQADCRSVIMTLFCALVLYHVHVVAEVVFVSIQSHMYILLLYASVPLMTSSHHHYVLGHASYIYSLASVPACCSATPI